MSSLNEILAAFSAFNQGLTKYAVNKGINDAKAQVDQLNQQEIGLMQKRQAQEQVAKDLALKLTSFGADQNDVHAAYGAIAPKAFQSPQDMYQQGLASGDKELMSAAREAVKFSVEDEKLKNADQYKYNKLLQDDRLAAMRENQDAGADKKASGQQVQIFKQLGDRFESANSKFLDGMQLAKTAQAMLASNNPVADKATINALVKASGDTGAITESDRQGFGGSEAYLDKLARAQAQATSGRLDQKSRQFLLDVSKIYERRAGEALQANAQRYAKRAAKLTGLDEQSALEYIYPNSPALLKQTANQPAEESAGAPVEVNLRNKKTGKIERLLRYPDGRLQPIK